ncbi:MAG TPA: ATP-dependent Clp protease ATP-binding subunit ClpA [Candidatus Binataceae bacterium]|jgi:ATP-dependent Clp protease ATP-binding subunit ClpA|nr:ATP-dependent Clp protease ATP-binding subunit ClpA [Candidatus Binataceae bacterium]
MASGIMLSRELQVTLQLAMTEAQSRRHEYVCLEHVLYAMLHDFTTSNVLKHCGANLDSLRRKLQGYLDEGVERLGRGAEAAPRYATGVQRALQRAAVHAQSAGRQEINGPAVLIAMFQEAESYALYFLQEEGVTRFDVINFVSHGVSKVGADAERPVHGAHENQGESEDEQDHEEGEGDDEDGAPKLSPARALKRYAINLADRAAKGKIDPLIGRKSEIERAIHILLRRRKNNPVFVGEAGVGKTALAEGLALAIHESRVPEALKGVEIFALDMGALLAGTRFRGDFEQRLKAVIKAATGNPKIVLFIDEIHTIVGAGSASGSTMDASNLLKPALASGELRCIGSTTYQEYKRSFDRDKALGRRFQRIDVPEPTSEEAVQILNGLKSYYEKHHNVRYTSPAIRAAVDLSARYINDRYLPDKAIDVMDEAGVAARLRASGPEAVTVGARDAERTVARMARIPERTVSSTDRARLQNLEEELKEAVFGQDPAIAAVARAIKLARSGLAHPDRPVGAFLFAGPTGVGKTEVARQLARVMGVEFLRFDMSEYMERHTVSRLIGAPPGYVGFDQGGLLTDAVNKNPHCVLLLDEIEKAHPDLFSILLQVMDHATLTDNNGRKADFRNVIIVMTTNAGAQELARTMIGFGTDIATGNPRNAIDRMFSPEFRNRLSAIIEFAGLGPEIIARVVDKFVGELAERLAAQKVRLEVSDAARKWLAHKGYDPRFGARPLGRLIESEVARALADQVLFGALSKGGVAKVDLADDKLVYSFEANAPKAAAPAPPVEP